MCRFLDRGLLLAGLACLCVAGRAPAQSLEETQPTLSVSGEGIVRVTPDMATVRFGVVTQAKDPEEARARNAEASREALNAVRALGIEERKIRLETLRLQPVREYNQEARRYDIVGYEAIRLLVAEVNDLETLPTLVARVVQEGANQLDGIVYDLQDRDAARNEALREAVLHAQEKGRLMATTLDRGLGRVLRIHEQSFDFPRPVPQVLMERAELAKADASPEPEAYAAGEIEVRATVQVVFTLE